MDMDALTRAYLNIRAKRHQIAAAFKEEDDDLKEKLGRIEAAMLKFLNDTGAQSMATKAGTFFKQEEITPQGSDWDAFYNWVREENAFDALERRIKKTFIADYQKANGGALPPGVSVYREYVARVRTNNK